MGLRDLGFYSLLYVFADFVVCVVNCANCGFADTLVVLLLVTFSGVCLVTAHWFGLLDAICLVLGRVLVCVYVCCLIDYGCLVCVAYVLLFVGLLSILLF